jgi:hypothetical protein
MRSPRPDPLHSVVMPTSGRNDYRVWREAGVRMRRRVLLVVCVAVALALVVTGLQIVIVELAPAASGVIEAVRISLMLAALGLALSVLLRYSGALVWGAVLPMVVWAVAAAMLSLMPWQRLHHEVRWRWHAVEYREAVKLAKRGELQPERNGTAWLPDWLQNLSADGQVLVRRQADSSFSLLFLTTPRASARQAGFWYDSKGRRPSGFRTVASEGRGWFYVSGRD